ncbi:MAG: DUF3263 domain-containing protein [Actinobacteria bacterium]|nr:MAG: DUF3263 domain-containing protein [Actinomycetota bacterium]
MRCVPGEAEMLALVHPPGKACDVELSPRERALLDFERSWRWLPGPKAEAIRAHLRMSAFAHEAGEPAAFGAEHEDERPVGDREFVDRRAATRIEGDRPDPGA